MLNLLFTLCCLFYEPRSWLHYPALNEIGAITFDNHQAYISTPDGIYILNLFNQRHLRTLTRADGIHDRIRFCAFNPSARELLIAGAQNLFAFIPATGQIQHLQPPFTRINSIGISPDGAYFETEQGLFKKTGAADRYQPVNTVPTNVRWYGQKDTTPLQKYTFLTPYYLMDEELIIRPLNRAYPEERTGKLYVTCPGYGIIIYNLISGLKEKVIRLGPPTATITSIVSADHRLWFLSPNTILMLDSTGNWYQSLNPAANLTFNRTHLLFSTALLELNRQEPITNLLSFPNRTLLSTTQALYALTSEGKPELLIQFNQKVNALALVRDSVLIGTDNGLFLLTDDTLTPITDPYARFDFGVYSIASTKQTTFFGARGRILQLDENNTWSQLLIPEFDLSQPVRTMTAAPNLLFVATDFGIDIFNLKTQTWTRLDTTTGLAKLQVTALYADENYLWIAAPDIISRYEYKKQLH
uniref:WD40 repeat domain-containing protein n=1 Tax=candidate division WOR-3 bacterium TaxID=2052148 RepID=A0A7V3PSU2_UNCW3